jgi:hypothetical protein
VLETNTVSTSRFVLWANSNESVQVLANLTDVNTEITRDGYRTDRSTFNMLVVNHNDTPIDIEFVLNKSMFDYKGVTGAVVGANTIMRLGEFTQTYDPLVWFKYVNNSSSYFNIKNVSVNYN